MRLLSSVSSTDLGSCQVARDGELNALDAVDNSGLDDHLGFPVVEEDKVYVPCTIVIPRFFYILKFKLRISR